MAPASSRLALLTPLFAVVTLPAGILAAMFVSLQAALAVFVVGWLLLVPATAILFGPAAMTGAFGPGMADEIDQAVEAEIGAAIGGDREDDRSIDPIEELRGRYARGEIDERELERGLEALLETEGVDAADEAAIEQTIRRLDEVDDGGSGAASDRDEDTATADELLTEKEE